MFQLFCLGLYTVSLKQIYLIFQLHIKHFLRLLITRTCAEDKHTSRTKTANRWWRKMSRGVACLTWKRHQLSKSSWIIRRSYYIRATGYAKYVQIIGVPRGLDLGSSNPPPPEIPKISVESSIAQASRTGVSISFCSSLCSHMVVIY